jgi:hypothetical protein
MFITAPICQSKAQTQRPLANHILVCRRDHGSRAISHHATRRKIRLRRASERPTDNGIQASEMFDFTGKRAIVTGASRGIGGATALGFGRAGAAADLEDAKRELASHATAHAAVCNLSNAAARWVYGQTLIVSGGQTLFGG